ncbi:hypothetical protein ACN47E_007086 [Coniothyrium glycines]
MPAHTTWTLIYAALLFAALPFTFAHGDEHDEAMNPSAHDALHFQAHDNEAPQSYWSVSDHTTLMYWHIALEILAWIVVLPIAVMLSIARSSFTQACQLVFLAINSVALVLGLVYNHSTPELYANDSHRKTGWIVTWVASAWVFMALVEAFASRKDTPEASDEAAQLMTTDNMARYLRVQDEEEIPKPRWSHDSGQGTERNSASLYGHSRSPSVETENQHYETPSGPFHDDIDSFDAEAEKRGFLHNIPVERFFSQKIARFAVGRTLKVMRFVSIVLERTLLVQGLVAIATGSVVYGGIGRGGAVFNVLAHYIKGGIFFLYGLLTLGRWMGAFADFGWAWNVKPTRDVVGGRKAAIPSAEFTESFVIWLYGITNVFLEHLAAWGDAWTAQDLEHVSISVMFLGCGTLGMIVESTKMRELLNSAVNTSTSLSQHHAEIWREPRQYRVSMNPLPALTIMLLGKMMSSHHQDSMLSTMIHGQWGSMFMGFALARGLTYILLYLSPPTSLLPSRPPTEIVTAFCLISGGITFVLSNKDTVAVLESYHLDAMFVFTVTMGLTALLMAWTTAVIAIKGWALQRESSSRHAKKYAGVSA